MENISKGVKIARFEESPKSSYGRSTINWGVKNPQINLGAKYDWRGMTAEKERERRLLFGFGVGLLSAGTRPGHCDCARPSKAFDAVRPADVYKGVDFLLGAADLDH